MHPWSSSRSASRLRDAMAGRRPRASIRVNLESMPTRDGGFSAMAAALAPADRPTAVVCYNDVVAIGAMLAAAAARAHRRAATSRSSASTTPARRANVPPALTTIAIDAVGPRRARRGDAAGTSPSRLRQPDDLHRPRRSRHPRILRRALARAGGRRLTMSTDRDQRKRQPCLSPQSSPPTKPRPSSRTGLSSRSRPPPALAAPTPCWRRSAAASSASGHPRNLTTLHPIAAGDMWGIKGIDHLAKPGLLARDHRRAPIRRPVLSRAAGDLEDGHRQRDPGLQHPIRHPVRHASRGGGEAARAC